MKLETIATVTTLIFVVLKLTDHIDWSWWWIFSPVFFHVGCLIILCIVGVIVTSKD